MKKFLNVPELVLIALGVFLIVEKYLSGGRVSYITLLVTWLLFLQVIYKNRICGIIYGTVLSAISVYKLFITLTGGVEMESAASLKFSLFFTVGLIMSAIMLYKYITTKQGYDPNVLTAVS